MAFIPTYLTYGKTGGSHAGDWIVSRHDLEHISAAWMIMPVSNAVSAMVGPAIQVKYRDACQVGMLRNI